MLLQWETGVSGKNLWCLEELIKAFFSHVTNPWFDLGCSLGSYLRL
jgi:hypothetical protein